MLERYLVDTALGVLVLRRLGNSLKLPFVRRVDKFQLATPSLTIFTTSTATLRQDVEEAVGKITLPVGKETQVQVVINRYGKQGPQARSKRPVSLSPAHLPTSVIEFTSSQT